MKTFVAVLLVSSLAWADPPVDTDTPTLAPDAPGVSVRLRAGETAPFDGRLLSLDENLRRGKSAATCTATLADAEANGVLLPKPAVATLISAAAAAVIASISLGIYVAAKK
jgi:hypothetical protein